MSPMTQAWGRLPSRTQKPPIPAVGRLRFDVVGGDHVDRIDFIRRSDARWDLLLACLLNDSARDPPGQDRLQWISPHFGPAGREGRGGI